MRRWTTLVNIYEMVFSQLFYSRFLCNEFFVQRLTRDLFEKKNASNNDMFKYIQAIRYSQYRTNECMLTMF